jgi:hypothetical protein
MSSSLTSCRCLSNMRTCLGNTRASLRTVAAKSSSISMAHGLWSATGHASALEPTSEVDVVQSRRPCISVGPLLSGEARSDAEGLTTAPDPLNGEAGSGASWYVAASETS